MIGLGAAVLLSSCGGDSGTDLSAIATVSITPPTLNLEARSTASLAASARDGRQTVVAGEAFYWSSTDTTVASVDDQGVVHALSPGDATIGARTVNGASGYAVVHVRVTYTAVSAGSSPVNGGVGHTCGRTVLDGVLCWGDNSSGRLGTGASLTLSTSRGQPVSDDRAFLAVSAGGHTCALSSDESAWCWGDNGLGQLGDGTAVDRSTPVATEGDVSFSVLSASSRHTCGVAVSGAAYCWGANDLGQLGDGSAVDRSTPTEVAGGLSFSTIDAGFFHTCGLTTDGDAYCWGGNQFDALGDGSVAGPETCEGPASCSTEPVPVAGGLTFQSLAVGQSSTCGVTMDGDAYCWGQGSLGMLGNGTTTLSQRTPAPVSGDHSFSTIDAGSLHVCALTTTGVAYCWGLNRHGQLGNGTWTGPESCTSLPFPCATTPVPVDGELLFDRISAGKDHTCALTTEGTAYCWGLNNSGQLGNGSDASPATCSEPPVSVPLPCSPRPLRVWGQF